MHEDMDRDGGRSREWKKQIERFPFPVTVPYVENRAETCSTGYASVDEPGYDVIEVRDVVPRPERVLPRRHQKETATYFGSR